MIDTEIKVFKNKDSLVYTDEFVKWLYTDAKPEEWLGEDYKTRDYCIKNHTCIKK